ncbi:MAG TPA: Rieske 2Fe-2S domain-containing protein [Alphaproteobacteria bacterium]|nr:Rieske 2Fe-2S domain-containing protein [Alphaproteobacteria bacterium]
MLTPQENEFLTRIGPGTPAGALLRRYWHPICPVAELTAVAPRKRIRILGENLLLFRDGSGRAGLILEQCPHRSASLFYGFVESDGIRCPYHGWKFDTARRCIEQPFEPGNTRLRERVVPSDYLVEEMAGLFWGYMGPKPAPLLPRWEAAVATRGRRRLNVLPVIDANWLQIVENSVDPTHTHYLHAHMMIALGIRDKGAYHARPIQDFDFEVVHEETWTGVRKIRVWGGKDGEREFGHPLIFPGTLLVPAEDLIVMHFRVPVDDTHTRVIRIQYAPDADSTGMDWNNPPIDYFPPFKNENGEYDLTTFSGQDAMAWETEGPIVDRSRELLGSSDRGIALYRRMLKEQIVAVAEGRDPVGLIRDPEKNREISIAVSTGQARMARQMKQVG